MIFGLKHNFPNLLILDFFSHFLKNNAKYKNQQQQRDVTRYHIDVHCDWLLPTTSNDYQRQRGMMGNATGITSSAKPHHGRK